MDGLQLDNTTLDLKQDANGRLQVGRVDEQNQYLLLKLAKGSIKRLPTRCVGVDSYVEHEDMSGMLREIKKEFTADGMKLASVKFVGENLEIDATYR